MNAFDAAGVRVSGGSACSSGKATESHVLAAMHLHKWRAQNAIRLSFGPGNSLEDIDEACRAIQAAGEALQASCMIPNLPARAEQLSQLMQVTGPGISELRSSQGTRAWLICQEENNSSKNFLVADCSRALCELQNKLACRGLTSTQILVLDEKHESQALPEDGINSKPAREHHFYSKTPRARMELPLYFVRQEIVSLKRSMMQKQISSSLDKMF